MQLKLIFDNGDQYVSGGDGTQSEKEQKGGRYSLGLCDFQWVNFSC